MPTDPSELLMINLCLALYAGSVFFSLWVIDTGKRRWVPQLATAIVVGLLGFTSAGYIAIPAAIAAMACYTAVATIYLSVGEMWKRQIRYGGMLLGLLAGVHLVPGIADIPLFSRWWGEGGRFLPFDFRLDKAYAGLLLALIAAQFHPQVRHWRWSWLMPAAVVVMVVLVTALGYPFEPHWPEYAAALLFVNLVVTCFAEELFFRGALQRELMLYLAPAPAIALTAVAFGLVHLGRGWEVALLAGVAGALYGVVYWRTGLLSAAVLTHFAVNVVWILGFPSFGAG